MKMDYAKDRDTAAHLHLDEYNKLYSDGQTPSIEPVWGAFCYGADWCRHYFLKDMLQIMDLQIKKDDEIRELKKTIQLLR